MHLIELMDRVPLWLVGLIVMIVAQTYAIGLMLLTRSIFGVSRLAENNEVAGFKLLTVIAGNRGERLDSADGSVPILMWFVLIVGGIITLSYPAFFGATNRWAQTLMTATLAALVALALLLALAMDYPFTGDEKISVQPFDEALDQMPPSLPTH
jgi:hypothetical protein